jgi:sortase (surface protein transpeptidase)
MQNIRDSCVVVLSLCTAVAATVVCARIILNTVYFAPQDQAASARLVQLPMTHAGIKAASGFVPDRLRIPSIGIDAHVEKVGINAKGNIGTPSTFETVAWYEYGADPGEVGTAIIDGHVNNGLGLPGVFANLATIGTGADIYVSDQNGRVLHFSVESTSTADYTDRLDRVPALNQVHEPELALITCEGTWVQSKKTYDQRIIILAKLI